MAEEKTYYIVNNTFISYEIANVVFPRQHFVAINNVKLDELKEEAVFVALINAKDLEVREEIDDSMRTTEEQLAVSRAELIKAKNEAESLKNEALSEIAKRDQEIAELKAQLAKSKKNS